MSRSGGCARSPSPRGGAARVACVACVGCVAAALALAACSSGTESHPSGPASLEYDIEFPSTAAAVAVETIQAFVYSTNEPNTDCPSLLVARAAKTELPTPLAQTDPVQLCDVLGGKAGDITGVAFGEVTFLVVAQADGNDYFTGCSLVTITPTSGPVNVQVSTTQAIPATTCQSVSEFCRGDCSVSEDGGPLD
jgi:hypothetical protein